MAGFLSKLWVHERFCPYLAVAVSCGIQCFILPQTAHALAPAIYGQPVSQAVLPGSNATFIVTAALPPLAYQWRFNGGNLSGATNSALTITNVQAANIGTYTAVITNISGVITSVPATLALATAPGFLWARTVTNGLAPNYQGHSAAGDVAADNDGNVFVAGTFSSDNSSLSSIDFGGGVLTDNSPTNNFGYRPNVCFICKYDRLGNFAWARQVATNSNDASPMRLRTDARGNVYFAGRFTGTATFGTNTLVSSSPIDVFVAKYNSQGEALWARQIRDAYNPNFYRALALAVDSNAS